MSEVAQKVTGATTRIRIIDAEGVDLPVDYLDSKGEKRHHKKGSLVSVPRAHALQLVNHRKAVEAMIIVRLSVPYKNHNAGEECGFSPEEANYIIGRKYGKAVKDDEGILDEFRGEDVQKQIPTRTNIRQMSWQEACRIVAREEDIELLEAYQKEDARASVQKAIKERMDELFNDDE